MDTCPRTPVGARLDDDRRLLAGPDGGFNRRAGEREPRRGLAVAKGKEVNGPPSSIQIESRLRMPPPSLDDLIPGVTLQGPLLPEPVEVVAATRLDSAVRVIGRGLHPTGSDERRWVEGVLARKKGLGFG